MEIIELDVAVIGAGTSGINAWRAATAEGAKALMIDPGPLGTTCARVGCMPSKVLIAAAEAAHHARHGEVFGVRVEGVHVDPVAVMERVRRMRDMFVGKTIERMGGDKRVLSAPGRFLDAHTIEVGDRRVVAKSIVIATGSRAVVPPPYRELGDALLTNENVFELARVPESLLVVGAGAIGLELGQAFHRLGSRVTVLDLEDRIGGLQDPLVAAKAREIFGEELDLQLRHQLRSVVREGDRVQVRFIDDRGEERNESYQYVLAATGRRPQLDGLGLGAAGLDPLPAVDPQSGQIGDSHFFLAGDVTGDRMLLHEAAHEGRIAGRNAALYPEIQRDERKVPLALVFTDPQIAVVGQRHDGIDPQRDLVAGLDFRFQARAKVLGRDRGQMQVYASPTGKLLGAEILGPDAEHLGHQLAWVIQRGLSAAEVVELPFYHPVIEEGLEGVLKALDTQVGARPAD